MSRLRIALLALSLGPVAAACADDGAWGKAPARSAPAAQMGRPLAGAAPTLNAASWPAAMLERPHVAAAAAVTDPQVQPALFGPVIRGQSPDAQPLPVGPSAPGEPIAEPRNWQRSAPEPTLAGAPFPAPTLVAAPEPVAADGDGCCFGRLWSWLHHDRCCDCACGCGAGPTACDCGCDGACDGDMNRLYVTGEYLLWTTKGDPLPPLVTAGSAADLLIPLVSAGALNRPGTTTLFGGSDADNRSRFGARVMVGWWFGDDHCIGLEGGGFFLGRQTDAFNATSFGAPLLARPFFNSLTGLPDAELVASPGNPAVPGVLARAPLAGTINVAAVTDFWGAEANLRTSLCRGDCYNVDLIGGYLYMGLDDRLSIGESLQAFGTAGPFAFQGTDTFKTSNRFNGGQIGLDTQFRRNRWSLDLDAKIAIGNVNETVEIFGAKSLNGVISAGDLLTQQGTNMGTFRRDRFAWSPQVGMKLGYQITDHMRAFVGYDFLYLSSVARAGSQVNLNVNPLPLLGIAGGPAQPSFALHNSDFWAQGVSAGLEFRY